MKGQRHPKVCVKLTVAEIQAIQEQMDKPDLWENLLALLCVELMRN